jgi:LacI family transcriptional regulator
MALLRTSHDLGLQVPRDFSLACFNDEPIVRLSIPSITAVDVPSLELGRTAAQELLSRMKSDGNGETPAPKRIRVDEKVIPRESTAPPRS